jgi:poly-gamma-glutamate synthesis protein (capsule biosynthesis protein)
MQSAAAERFDAAFLGDVYPVGARWSGSPAEARGPFAALAPLLRGLACASANFEGSTAVGLPSRPDKSSILEIEADATRALREAGISHLALANNHVWDHCDAGLLRTLADLRARGFACYGAGEDAAAARRPAHFAAADGTRVALVAFTSDAPHTRAHLAGPASPGCAGDAPGEMLEDVRQLRAQGLCPVVQLHAGPEYRTLPAPDEVARCRALVEAGAAAVLCHHAHVVRPCERYRGAFIAYGLGNAFFPSFPHRRGRPHVWPRNASVSLLVRLAFAHGNVARAELRWLECRGAGAVRLLPAPRATLWRARGAAASGLLGRPGHAALYRVYDGLAAARRRADPAGSTSLPAAFSHPPRALWRALRARLRLRTRLAARASSGLASPPRRPT